MTPIEWTVAIAAVAIGACAQGALGFGLGLVAAPVLAITDEDFVPGPLLIVAMVLTVIVALRERGGIDWKGLRWAIIGRVPGSVAGTFAVVLLPERGLIILFAVLVLSGVGLSVAGWRLEATPPTLFTAGATSGFMGSITSIGGPPMALVYQRHTGPQLRSTLAGFFVFGSTLSIVLLVAAGEIHTGDLGRAAALLPAMLGGYVASRFLARWLDKGYLRSVLLAFSAATCVALLVIELT